jgi:hypothetical protein
MWQQPGVSLRTYITWGVQVL